MLYYILYRHHTCYTQTLNTTYPKIDVRTEEKEVEITLTEEATCKMTCMLASKYLSSSIITSKRSERNFLINVYGRSFWRFKPGPNRTESSDFCEPYISASIRVIILKQKPMLTFLNCDISNFHSNQPNLSGMTSIQTVIISDNFSIN